MAGKGAGKIPTGFAAETYISEHTFRQGHRAIEGGANSKKRKYEEERPDAASDEEYGSDEEVEIIYEEDEIEANPEPAPKKLAGTDYHDTDAEGETSEFVGSQQYDYQGRTYMHVPNGMFAILERYLTATDERRSGHQAYRRLRTEELYTQEAPTYLQVPHEINHTSTVHT